MKEGAYDYITKPFKVDEIRHVVEKALEKKLLSSENERLRSELRGRKRARAIIGTSPVMQRVYDLIHGLADLSTRPGSPYSGGPIRYIRPDVVIEWEDGDYVVRLINDHLPRVGLSGNVRKMLEQARGDPKVKEYLKRKIDSAKWLIEAIAQRRDRAWETHLYREDGSRYRRGTPIVPL